MTKEQTMSSEPGVYPIDSGRTEEQRQRRLDTPHVTYHLLLLYQTSTTSTEPLLAGVSDRDVVRRKVIPKQDYYVAHVRLPRSLDVRAEGGIANIPPASQTWASAVSVS